eukprot:3357365-Rhodomonas_salina.1
MSHLGPAMVMLSQRQTCCVRAIYFAKKVPCSTSLHECAGMVQFPPEQISFVLWLAAKLTQHNKSTQRVSILRNSMATRETLRFASTQLSRERSQVDQKKKLPAKASSLGS